MPPTEPSADHVDELKQRLCAVEDELREGRRRRRRALVAVALLVGIAAPLSWAADGNCPNGLPFCFAADAPARASDVNHNFAQLKEWLEAKVGSTASSNLTAGAVSASSLTVSGSTTLGSTTASGATVTGNATVNGTLSLGASGVASFRAMSWCDCELENQLSDRGNGNVITAQVPYQFIFEGSSGAGVFECRGGRFLVGIEKTSAGCTTSVGCLEQYKCCRPCNLRAQ